MTVGTLPPIEDVLPGAVVPSTGTVKNGSKREAAFIIPPVSITKANWKVLYTSGFMKKSDICNGTYKKYC